MKKAKIWYVIADGGRARFVERDDTGAFRTFSSFVSTELHDRSGDLGRDRPSRVRDSATSSRHAIEPKQDLHTAAKQDFVRQVVAELEGAHGEGSFDQLVLVAPARVLAQLKEELSKPLAKLLRDDVQKDLTKVPDHDLTEHLVPAR
jgi:protein required for attachment to host cells